MRFLQLIPADGCVVVCSDHPSVRELLASAALGLPIQTYGVQAPADWCATECQPRGHGMQATVRYRGKLFGQFSSPLMGRHNVQNLLAAVAVATHLGLSAAQIAAGLQTFRHLKRRGEIRGEADGVTVIDDFAHHPTAVRVTLAAVRQAYPEARLWAVFEPRTATSRRAVFQQDYAEALGLADRVVIADVYRRDQLPAAERLSPETLVTTLQARRVPAQFLPTTQAIIAHLCREARDSDVILVMSNGGFDDIHARLLTALEQRSIPSPPTGGIDERGRDFPSST